MMHWWCAKDSLMMRWWSADDALMMRSWCTDDALNIQKKTVPSTEAVLILWMHWPKVSTAVHRPKISTAGGKNSTSTLAMLAAFWISASALGKAGMCSNGPSSFAYLPLGFLLLFFSARGFLGLPRWENGQKVFLITTFRCCGSHRQPPAFFSLSSSSEQFHCQ